MVADFQQFYGIRIRDALDGAIPAGHVLELVPGLMQEKFSRFRAKWLKNNPVPESPGEGTSFFGWSQDSMLLAQIHNAIIAVNAGQKAKDLMILAPRAKQEQKLFAQTIADFSVGKFMSVINNSK